MSVTCEGSLMDADKRLLIYMTVLSPGLVPLSLFLHARCPVLVCRDSPAISASGDAELFKGLAAFLGGGQRVGICGSRLMKQVKAQRDASKPKSSTTGCKIQCQNSIFMKSIKTFSSAKCLDAQQCQQ